MATVVVGVENNGIEQFLEFLKSFKNSKITILNIEKSDDEYLKSIPGMEESIIEASKEPIENYVTLDKLDW